MKTLMEEQAQQLDEQSREIAAMKTQLTGGAPAAQPAEALSAAAPAAMPAPAITLPIEVPAAATNAATASTSKATLAADTAAPQHSPLFFKIGDATFTPLGFMDLTAVFRTTATGNGIGTTFGGIPYMSSLPTAGLTELRFSAQNSRVGIRIEAPAAGGKVTGYLEADFLGLTASNFNVSSNSNTMRMRNYFADYTRGKWEFLAGQDWSMLTPNRKGISPYPSDIFYSQDMDTNYQVGLTWARQPQVRLVYHPNASVALGVSIENANQLIGGAATTPANFTSPTSLAAELDPSSGGTLATPATPNVGPDVIVKMAADHMVGKNNWHFDVAGLFSEYKLVTPASLAGAPGRVTKSAPGGGFEVNLNLELVHNFHWITTVYASDGGARYLYGQGPDAVVYEATTTSPFVPKPVKADSAIGGFEWQATPKSMLYGYYGGDLFGRSFSADPSKSTLTYVGYGYPNGPNSQNRAIQEGTVGWIQTFFKSPNFGGMSLITQASYLQRNPWALATNEAGGKDAHLFMVYVDLRYTLP